MRRDQPTASLTSAKPNLAFSRLGMCLATGKGWGLAPKKTEPGVLLVWFSSLEASGNWLRFFSLCWRCLGIQQNLIWWRIILGKWRMICFPKKNPKNHSLFEDMASVFGPEELLSQDFPRVIFIWQRVLSVQSYTCMCLAVNCIICSKPYSQCIYMWVDTYMIV